MGKFDDDPPRHPEAVEHVLADGRVVRITTVFGHLVVDGERMARHTRTQASIDGAVVNPHVATELVEADRAAR